MRDEDDKPKLKLAEVVTLRVETKLDIDCERVLNGAINADMQKVLLMGYDSNGEFYLASSTSDTGLLLVLLEKTRKRLLESM